MFEDDITIEDIASHNMGGFKSVEDFMDDLLSYLELSERKRFAGKNNEIPLSNFRNIETLVGAYVPSIKTDVSFISPNLIKPSDLDAPINVSVLSRITDDPEKRFKFSIEHIQQISPADVRGKVKMVFPTMVKLSFAWFTHAGTFETGQCIAGWNGNSFVYVKRDRIDPLSKEANDLFKMAMSIQFTHRYNWRVSLGYGGPSVAFMTDPVGAREIFRLRDIPDGKNRRAAIRNWVSHHYRKKHDDPSALTDVRKHLRGATEFNWNGMRVTILPSKFDLEMNEGLKNEIKS